jgi:hypothetical protein
MDFFLHDRGQARKGLIALLLAALSACHPPPPTPEPGPNPEPPQEVPRPRS